MKLVQVKTVSGRVLWLNPQYIGEVCAVEGRTDECWITMSYDTSNPHLVKGQLEKVFRDIGAEVV